MNGFPATLQLSIGLDVVTGGRKGRIVGYVDLQTVQIVDYDTGEIIAAKAADVKPVPLNSQANPIIDALSDKDMALAQTRFQWIMPLVDRPGRDRVMVNARAKELGLHPATLYKWLRIYESTRLLSALASRQRKDKGNLRLSPTVETIIQEVLNSDYLTDQRKKPAWIAREVKRKCRLIGEKIPHYNTIRNRINDIPAYQQTSSRFGRKAAQESYSPNRGEFPGAEWPLAVVQIDHTPLDIIVVDDMHRESIGRPWITMAIDVFSRMVAGFCISLDPPGALSTGLCLVHAILPKDAWLAERKLEGDWPVWGKPTCIHADNAKEFRGSMLERACAQYHINTEWRPVAKPHYGGHIERLLGTFAKELHALPGTTFSNTRDRGEYDSEGKAAFTFGELETWLAELIVSVYHCELHSAINMPPIEKFKQGILGDGTRPGVGLPPRIMDEAQLRLDFMPFLKRTVQTYGIQIDEIEYWHDVLRPWINATDPHDAKSKRRFLIRRDPRDISRIWFLDPELKTYFEIPYRDTSHPPISVWELRQIRRRLRDEGIKSVDENQIFEALTRLREIEERAVKDTKAARRARQRRKLGIGATAGRLPPATQPAPIQEHSDAPEDLQPFEVMDDLS